MKRSRIAAALIAAAAVASPALADIPAGVPDALSPDPVVRGALIAMPSVWDVQVTAHMTSLRLKNGQVVALPPAARTVQKEGTAFAVTPDGFLLSALHVVSPSPVSPTANRSPPTGSGARAHAPSGSCRWSAWCASRPPAPGPRAIRRPHHA